MIIPDERALKNLSESPYVCVSKLFLQPKKTVLSIKMHAFKYTGCFFLNVTTLNLNNFRPNGPISMKQGLRCYLGIRI